MGLGDVEVTAVRPRDRHGRRSTSPANADTVANIRIWDPATDDPRPDLPAAAAASATTTGSTTSTSTATSSTASPPRWCCRCATSTPPTSRARRWAAEHLTYTHGYGAIVAPANAKEASGEPRLRRQGRPVRQRRPTSSSSPSRPSTSARTSAATSSSGSKQQELSFQDGRGTQYTAYEGDDGVALDNLAEAGRVRAALRRPQPADLRPAHRRARRSSTSATSASGCRPWRRSSHFDADPYPVIHDGRIKWIIDAYTTTNRYPYGERAETGAARRRQRARPQLQLRAELGEGRRRRLRRHRRLLRDAGRRPDHRGLPRRLPRAVHGLRGDARGPAGRTSATRRTCSGCRPTSWARYHVDRAEQLLRGQRLLGRRPRPRHRRAPARAPASTNDRRATTVATPRRAHRPVLPVHQAPRRRRARVHPPAAVRADVRATTTASCSPRSWSARATATTTASCRCS